jgi:hypothetical protein
MGVTGLEARVVMAQDDPDEEVILLRTSDRSLFRRCRRLWGWISHLKMGLQVREQADYLWFGTGIHFALEDFHGYNVYGHAGRAFLAYVEASRRADNLPGTWQEHVVLGLGMMSYYSDYWLVHRDPLQTLWIDGVPQVEVNTQIDLGVRDKRGRRILYGLTMDRMLQDEHDQLWICEYKTAKQFREYHFDFDEQITSYAWGATKLYQQKIAGVVYMQFKKQVPQLPRVLSTGEISVDKRQPTTAALYTKMLMDMFGSLTNVPQKYVLFLNGLISEDTEDADRFINRTNVERNEYQIARFEERLHLELEDMLNEDLPLYPNFTNDCSWGCPLQHACLGMEDGSDYEQTLASYVRRSDRYYFEPKEDTSWHKALPHPEDPVLQLPEEAQLYSQLLQEAQTHPERLSPEQAFLEEHF